MFCRIMCGCVVLGGLILRYVILGDVICRYLMLYHVIFPYVVLCGVTKCYACYVVLCDVKC